MRTFSGIVKGASADVYREALEHGITVLATRTNGERDEVLCLFECETEQVLQWFQVSDKFKAPYPAGSLLWFSPTKTWPGE